MATLVNKMNREVKVTIPNMREFRTFYSDNEGVIGMFFKRDWEEVKQESSWKPSDEQKEALEYVIRDYREDGCNATANYLQEILDHLKNM